MPEMRDDTRARADRPADVLHLPHASRGDLLGARDVPQVRHEARTGAGGRADILRLPHASRGHLLGAGDVPQVWDEARALRCATDTRFGVACGFGTRRARTWRRP